MWEAEREDAAAREGREGPPQLAAPVEWIRTRVWIVGTQVYYLGEALLSRPIYSYSRLTLSLLTSLLN